MKKYNWICNVNYFFSYIIILTRHAMNATNRHTANRAIHFKSNAGKG